MMEVVMDVAIFFGICLGIVALEVLLETKKGP